LINLYPDQLELVDATRDAMRRHKSVLVQAATGAGKTVLASFMIQSAVTKGSRCIFMVPRRELLRQTALTLDSYHIPYGLIASGYPENPFARINLATVGTLARRLNKAPSANILFVDETHFGGDDVERVINHYKAKGAWIIGLSATPWKLSGKGLGEWYDHMVMGKSIRWLIENNRLSDYRLFAPSRPDLSGIKTIAGDYNKGQLDDKMTSDRVLIGDAVRHYKDRASGALNIAFCTSIKHSEIVAQEFRDQGIPAAHVSGKMDDTEIKALVRAFARRELHVIANCELLTFGFDLASAAGMDVTVECLSDLRPTKSLSLQLQKWGRALRKKDFPAMIFDHAGNSEPDLHGLPDSDRQWSLAGQDRKSRGGEKSEPTRQCPECYFVSRPSPLCPNCGFVHPIKSREVEHIDGELQEIERDRVERVKERQTQGMAKTLEDLIRIGKLKGHKNPELWAAHIMTARSAKVKAA